MMWLRLPEAPSSSAPRWCRAEESPPLKVRRRAVPEGITGGLLAQSLDDSGGKDVAECEGDVGHEVRLVRLHGEQVVPPLRSRTPWQIARWQNAASPVMMAPASGRLLSSAKAAVISSASGAIGAAPIVLIAGLGAVSICFACVALISRFGDKRELPPEEVAEIERGGYVIGGRYAPRLRRPRTRPRAGSRLSPVSATKEA